MQAETERQYFPENWKPLERWLSLALCRRMFSWMWNEHGYECYRGRDNVDPVKVEPLLSELTMYRNGLLAEQEEQCRTFLKTTQCWLR
jgi:hypothetical protein